jgi:hypothetical protein
MARARTDVKRAADDEAAAVMLADASFAVERAAARYRRCLK